MKLRAPAVPLVTYDPYFSIWSMSDSLNDDPTRHWTSVPHPLTGEVTLNEKIYRFYVYLYYYYVRASCFANIFIKSKK